MPDRLTGLPSRRAFERRLRDVIASGCTRGAGIVHIDLDRFETVNQTLGRTAGDELLVQAADRLRVFGRRGRFVARLGSDRFGVLTEAAEETMDLANEAITLLARVFPIGSDKVAITASAGVTVDGQMDSADIALGWAKSDGRATCRRFEPARNQREDKRRQLWIALPSAMACEQIRLHYQPLVDLRSGRMIGAEALARWTHPVHGPIPPETFIGIAEESGLIAALGAILLRQACEAAATWTTPANRPAPYVSVNVSAAQLRDLAFFETVTNTLRHTGLAPSRLQLEITEHTLVETDPQTLKNLHDLTRLGVRIAVDDFGTGYNNLLTLCSLPVHELKLAHSFIQNGSRELLSTILNVGRAMKLTMTAEGIETKDRAELMNTLGCDTGQGWHFGRPMSAERLRDYL
jgi:diguanylate cyclase (GGDEF)-like protein